MKQKLYVVVSIKFRLLNAIAHVVFFRSPCHSNVSNPAIAARISFERVSLAVLALSSDIIVYPDVAASAKQYPNATTYEGTTNFGYFNS